MMSLVDRFQFLIFEQGEIAALGGTSFTECPYSKEQDGGLRKLWFRGYNYGVEEGEH